MDMYILQQPILNPRTERTNQVILFLHNLRLHSICHPIHRLLDLLLDMVAHFIPLQKPIDEPHILAIMDGALSDLLKDGLETVEPVGHHGNPKHLHEKTNHNFLCPLGCCISVGTVGQGGCGPVEGADVDGDPVVHVPGVVEVVHPVRVFVFRDHHDEVQGDDVD